MQEQQSQHPGFISAMEAYQQERLPEDVDLLTAVRDLLISSGLFKSVETAFDTNRFIIEAKDKPSDAQRFLLNRYWSLQLMQSSKVSVNERYSLIPNGDIAAWYRLFKNVVLPFIIENNLPVVI
jgi:hypothetical protein